MWSAIFKHPSSAATLWSKPNTRRLIYTIGELDAADAHLVHCFAIEVHPALISCPSVNSALGLFSAESLYADRV